MTEPERAAFIVANTRPLQPPHCPEITLHLADEAVALWQLTEDELEQQGLPPPFWAFAWAGGQGLARFVLDHPEVVRGKRVVDLASGSGLVAIAAMMAGASQATAVEVDQFAITAIHLNAELNGMTVHALLEDIIDSVLDTDVLLVGDLFYDRDLATRLWDWLQVCAVRGADVVIGDPGRAYLPKSGLIEVASYQVAVSRALEDAEVKNARVWRLASCV
jgi:predicted nicotinamide N-methyase